MEEFRDDVQKWNLKGEGKEKSPGPQVAEGDNVFGVCHTFVSLMIPLSMLPIFLARKSPEK